MNRIFSFVRIEFVFTPIFWVVDDVIGNALVFCIIAYDVVVETYMPSVGQFQAVGVFGYGRFVGSQDGRNGI